MTLKKVLLFKNELQIGNLNKFTNLKAAFQAFSQSSISSMAFIH